MCLEEEEEEEEVCTDPTQVPGRNRSGSSSAGGAEAQLLVGSSKLKNSNNPNPQGKHLPAEMAFWRVGNGSV